MRRIPIDRKRFLNGRMNMNREVIRARKDDDEKDKIRRKVESFRKTFNTKIFIEFYLGLSSS